MGLRSGFQAHSCIPVTVIKLIAGVLLLFSSGCATTFALIESIAPESYAKGNYEKHIEEAKTKHFFREDVKNQILNESINELRGGGEETQNMRELRRAYLELSRALIETGNFISAAKVCDAGIRLGKRFEQLRPKNVKTKPKDIFFEYLATKVLFNYSIMPDWDNDTFLRRLQLYKSYIVWFTTGNKDAAFREFESYLKDVPTSGQDKSFLVMDRGYFYMMLGKYTDSMDQFAHAVDLIAKMTLSNVDMKQSYTENAYAKIADLNVILGDLASAEKSLAKSEELQGRIVYKIGKLISNLKKIPKSITASKMGSVYALLRDNDKSEKQFQVSFDIVKNIDPKTDNYRDLKAISTYNIFYGVFYQGLLKSDYAKAAEYVDNGIIYLRDYYLESVQEEPSLESAYLYSSELHFLMGKKEFENGYEQKAKLKFREAIDKAEKAIHFAIRHRNTMANAAGHTLLGQIYFETNNYSISRREYEAARDLVGNEPSTENWKLFHGLGRVYELEGNHEYALKYYVKSVEEVEKLWGGRFKDTVKQVRFIDDRLVVFEPVISMFASRGNISEAIGYMEKSKSRTFFESSLFYSEYNKGIKGLDEPNRKGKAITDIVPLNGVQIMGIIPDNTAILEYYVGKSTVIGAVITKDQAVLKKIGMSSQILKKSVQAFRREIADPGQDHHIELGSSLYVSLIAPFEEQLVGVKMIGIVPHGVLHYLPFQALSLPDDSEGGAGRGVAYSDLEATKAKMDSTAASMRISTGTSQALAQRKKPTYLINKYDIFYAPSSTILNFVRENNPMKKEKLLALGSPPAIERRDKQDPAGDAIEAFAKLPYAKEEVEAVGALFPNRTVLTDEAATESVVKNKAGEYDIILFSTHGMMNYKEPLKTFLYFNKDSENNGRLEVSEIEKLGLNANLVVLSACETGLVTGYEGAGLDLAESKFPYGDDLVGMQRAFMKSGSASIMSTLWKVSDDSTKTLVVDFFKRLNERGNKASALRDAEIALMRQGKRWDHPYYWAPFVLSGDWR